MTTMTTALEPTIPIEAWRQDPRPTLSPTALSSYEICGKRGQYYHDPNVPKKSSMGTAIGSAWHKALEWADHELERPRPRDLTEGMSRVSARELATRMADPHFQRRDGEPLHDEALAQLDKMIRAYVSAPEPVQWREDGVTVVGTEIEVFADFGSDHHIFHGYLDKVMDVRGILVGVDNKSAGRAYGGRKGDGDPRELPQAPLYAEGFWRMYDRELDHFAFDVTTKAGRFDRIWVPTDREARQPFIERWREVSESIHLHEQAELPMPANPSHFLCSEKWCDYYEICPMGEPIDVILKMRGT